MGDRAIASTTIDGRDLRSAFDVAERWLALNRDAVNAINVYPVPDGDTGTNMLLTWRAALAAPVDTPDDVGAVLRAVAHGALLGARGNSGVILSQMLRGLAEAVGGARRIGLRDLAAALTAGARAAYDAVPSPIEGTMLTVMRESAAAAEAAAAERAEVDHMTAALVAGARRSVERTPDLLPRLRDAGVVDAGGLGVALLFEGVHHGLAGTPLPEPLTPNAAAVELEAVAHEGHGYCTEYVVIADGIDRAAFERELLALGGESVLVVGDATAVHVHVHVADPGPALSAGARLGALDAIKVDNMQAQHEAWSDGIVAASGGREPADGELRSAAPAVGLVAVAAGPGIASAFRDLGATRVIDAAARKPSAGELLAAARAAGRERVYLLPNDRDVLMAAEQAARASDGLVTVIPARSAAAGLAAAVAFLPDAPAAELAAQMLAAVDAVRSVEVTSAVRDATVDGVAVRAGDGIALVDGFLVMRGDTLEEALAGGLARAVGDGASLVTVYLGAGAPPGAGERVRALIASRHPTLEIEVVAGGQPHYPYLLSVE